MSILRSAERTVRLAAAVAAAWAGASSSAWAQESGAQQSFDYTLGYGLVLLGIVLGLLCVLKPSGRRAEVGPQHYVSKNLMVSEDESSAAP